jgi:ribonucleotide monophosphatase NagD (HAD superfamily)
MYFEAALAALEAEPKLTWIVGDDIEADIAGGQRFGLRTALVRTGKFRPDDLDRFGVTPDIVVNSLAELPDWLERAL